MGIFKIECRFDKNKQIKERKFLQNKWNKNKKKY